jgi:hypothetical protein
MMFTDHIARMTAAFAVGISVLVWVGFGQDEGIGAVVGGALSVANVGMMRFIAKRLTSGVVTTQASAAFLLSGKLALMAAICWLVIARLHVNALGFALGTGALLLGLFVGFGRTEMQGATASEET